jgi:hypothetical protein
MRTLVATRAKQPRRVGLPLQAGGRRFDPGTLHENALQIRIFVANVDNETDDGSLASSKFRSRTFLVVAVRRKPKARESTFARVKAQPGPRAVLLHR